MERLVTKIEVQKNNKDRVNVYIDNQFEMACSAELVYTFQLKAGKPVDMDKLKTVVSEDNYLKCKSRALKLIERSYKCEKEIFDKLVLKGYEEDTIGRVIAFMKSYGFIDDEKYASAYVKEKARSQGKGKTKYALIRKGINEEAVEEALQSLDSSSEYDRALSLAEKRLKNLAKSEKDSRKIQRKLGDYLIRNGYSGENVREILNTLMKNYEEESCLETSSKCFGEENKEDDTEIRNYVSTEETSEKNYEDLLDTASKRYRVLIKSESDQRKIFKKLSEYLMRRGYSYEDIKRAMKEVISTEDES